MTKGWTQITLHDQRSISMPELKAIIEREGWHENSVEIEMDAWEERSGRGDCTRYEMMISGDKK